ncbi:MAG: diguanylate cyclase [Synechococcales cyanobacterium RM1_1_8]|nr:diguanylate cyclase [Synechococcales cyanobacterium RM1_1_8]
MRLAPPSNSNPAGDRPRTAILVVDDNPNNLSLAVEFLAATPFNVCVAMDGETALEIARLVRPQIMLLDVMLPDISGFEFCERLKQQPDFQGIAVIFMTVRSEPQDKARGFAVGGVDYITKPLERLELLSRLMSHARSQARIHALEQQQQALQRQYQQLEARHRSLLTDNHRLQALIHLDSLTQVGNRRCFDTRLGEEWLRLRRAQLPLSLILLDIDYFKAYNDFYGHPAGDDCLVQVAQSVGRVLKRPGDLLTRYGGEEFAIVLPASDVAGALYVADRIQAEIQQLGVPHAASPLGPLLTVSQGVSTLVPSMDQSVLQLIQDADQALYLAKRQGRNQVIHRRHASLGPSPEST